MPLRQRLKDFVVHYFLWVPLGIFLAALIVMANLVDFIRKLFDDFLESIWGDALIVLP